MDGMDRTRGYHSCRILSLCTPCTCDCMILPAHVETPNHRPVPSRRVEWTSDAWMARIHSSARGASRKGESHRIASHRIACTDEGHILES